MAESLLWLDDNMAQLTLRMRDLVDMITRHSFKVLSPKKWLCSSWRVKSLILDPTEIHHLWAWRFRGPVAMSVGDSKTWRWPLTLVKGNSRRLSCNHSSTTTRNWTGPSTWMSLVMDSYSESLGRSTTQTFISIWVENSATPCLDFWYNK